MLNLARKPFVNDRPLRRLSVLLWSVGAALLVANLALYWRHFSGAEQRGQQLVEFADAAEAERRRLAELETLVADLDLTQQNREVRYLNRRIGERTFPWSRLFDHLSAVLPVEIRVTSLRPHVAERSRRAGEPPPPETVMLEMRGEARSGEALLELLEALFAHPNFFDPNLASEARQEAGTIAFDLATHYLAEREAPAEGEAVPAGGGGGEPDGSAEGAG